MKAFTAFLKISAGMLLFFFALIGSGSNAFASTHAKMHDHGTMSNTACQTRCANNTATVTVTNPVEQEDDDKQPAPAAQEVSPVYWPTFAAAAPKHTNPAHDWRLLRPPDAQALHCLYRI